MGFHDVPTSLKINPQTKATQKTILVIRRNIKTNPLANHYPTTTTNNAYNPAYKPLQLHPISLTQVFIKPIQCNAPWHAIKLICSHQHAPYVTTSIAGIVPAILQLSLTLN